SEETAIINHMKENVNQFTNLGGNSSEIASIPSKCKIKGDGTSVTGPEKSSVQSNGGKVNGNQEILDVASDITSLVKDVASYSDDPEIQKMSENLSKSDVVYNNVLDFGQQL